jgi:hydrophobic/amphiphilic exporter-1 (mainly G- bacteria), HAE1 family
MKAFPFGMGNRRGARRKTHHHTRSVNFNVTTESGMGGGMGGGGGVEVQVFGHDLEATTLYARELQDRIQNIDGAREVQISREKFKPELTINLDREKMALHGLSTAVVSSAIRNRVAGLIATRFRQFGDEYNVVVRYKEDARSSITDLENILVASPTGSMVRLKELGTIEQTMTPPNIERKAQTTCCNRFRGALSDYFGPVGRSNTGAKSMIWAYPRG